MTNITVIKGDITTQSVNAIVNAANTSLLGGGGVNGAIHRAAGPQLLDECRTLKGCKTGEAKITRGYNLPAKHVIHTAGPVWHGGSNNEQQLLYNAYYNSLTVAMNNGMRTIAFPGISTGIYGFPKQLAAATALRAVSDFNRKNPDAITDIIFVCFDDENLNIYKSLLDLP
ncbi:MAG: O-acetyl-ADP-ribose deacetylase [Bacteroidota bacterium]